MRGIVVKYPDDYCPTETWTQIWFTDLDLLLPEEPGVYVIFDENHRCIYIGESKNLSTRWLRHENWFPALREGADYCRYFVTDKHVELERHMIVNLEPVLNRQHNTQQGHEKYFNEFGYCPFIFRAKEWV